MLYWQKRQKSIDCKAMHNASYPKYVSLQGLPPWSGCWWTLEGRRRETIATLTRSSSSCRGSRQSIGSGDQWTGMMENRKCERQLKYLHELC